MISFFLEIPKYPVYGYLPAFPNLVCSLGQPARRITWESADGTGPSDPLGGLGVMGVGVGGTWSVRISPGAPAREPLTWGLGGGAWGLLGQRPQGRLGNTEL